MPGLYEDHWVCELWDETGARWRRVDAQIDDAQRRHFGPKDALDVTHEEFVVGGEAWAGIRAGRLDAKCFGLSSIGESGLWFVCGDFVRDVAALNKVELLPWDLWGVMHRLGEDGFPLGPEEVVARLPEGDVAELDRVAPLTAGAVDVAAVRAAYPDERWCVPPGHPALAVPS